MPILIGYNYLRMSKKELRKELELSLVKEIENVLNKLDAAITGKIRKTTYQASKQVAKKFYKALKLKTTASTKTVVNKPKQTKTVSATQLAAKAASPHKKQVISQKGKK